MKKALLASVMAVAAVAAPSLLAEDGILVKLSHAPVGRFEAPAKARLPFNADFTNAGASRADGDDELAILIGNAADSYNCFVSADTANTSVVALCMPEEDVRRYAGAKISGMYLCHGPIYDPQIESFYAFITHDLQNPFEYVDTIPLKNRNYVYQDFFLSKPHVIQADEGPLYMGWGVTTSGEEKDRTWPFSYDYLNHPEYFSDYWGVYCPHMPEGEKWLWKRLGQDCGEINIYAYLTGEGLPVNDMKMIEVAVPAQVNPGEPFDCDFVMKNVAANKISEIEYEVTVDGGAPEVHTLKLTDPIGFHDNAAGSVTVTVNSTGINVPVTIRITKVNGVADTDESNNSMSHPVTCVPKDFTGYQRNVVIEEGTGLWCGWCPRGYAGMEAMAEKYLSEGRLSLIAVHGGDLLAIPEYAQFLKLNIPGFPKAMVNRAITTDPAGHYLETHYANEKDRAAYCKVDVKAAMSDDQSQILISPTIEMAFDDLGKNFKIACVVTEDQLGPYPQTNYYEGGGMGSIGGFGELPDPAMVLHHHVAIAANDGMGERLQNVKINKGEAYTIPTVKLSADNMRNRENCRAVAILLNASTGQVENVASCEIAADLSAISEISNDSASQPARWFNLQGREINPASAAPGIYIKRQGSTATKTLLK